MTAAPVRIRRDVTEWSLKTGWRWTCLVCPPVRGRVHGGFHQDHRFTIHAGRYPDAWTRCLRAAIRHVHVKHRDLMETL